MALLSGADVSVFTTDHSKCHKLCAGTWLGRCGGFDQRYRCCFGVARSGTGHRRGILAKFGVIGFGGVAAFIVGAMLLLNTDVLGITLDFPVVVCVAVIGVFCVIGLIGAALKARRRQVVSGDAGLIGSDAMIIGLRANDALGGWVQLQGEHWQVVSQAPLVVGQRVHVVGRQGLKLEVMPVSGTPQRGD